MSRFPTPEEIVFLNRTVAERLGVETGAKDIDMIRAILLGVRFARRGSEVHSDRFLRAAVLLREILKSVPFEGANRATAVAAALLYLDRHGVELDLASGVVADLIERVQSGTDDDDATARRLEASVAPTPAVT